MGVDRHDAGSVRRGRASPSQDLPRLSAGGSGNDHQEDDEARSIRAQIAVWLGLICAIIAGYFLLFPIVAFWLFRLSVDRSHRLESTLETLCAPLEWLQERLPWYDIYLTWLMELLIG